MKGLPLGLLLLLAACRVAPPAPAPAEGRWVHAERSAAGLGLEAGDARVAGTEPVLALVKVPARKAGPPSRRLALDLPAEAGVGEEFEIGVRAPGAGSGESRRVRVVPLRPGLRLPDGDVVELRGAGPAKLRAVADSAGPAEFRAEEIR